MRLMWTGDAPDIYPRPVSQSRSSQRLRGSHFAVVAWSEHSLCLDPVGLGSGLQNLLRGWAAHRIDQSICQPDQPYHPSSVQKWGFDGQTTDHNYAAELLDLEHESDRYRSWL